MSETSSVTIVGGGVIGCFLAYRLVLAGISVTVIERERIGAGASGASAGNVQAVTGTHGAFEVALGAESLGLWRRFLPAIKEESGLDLLDHEVHYLYAALDEQEVIDIQAFTAVLHQGGLRVEWIDGNAARRLEPRLAPEIRGGMLHQDVVQMDAQRCVVALAKIVEERGGQLQYGEVIGLSRDHGRVTGVQLRHGSTVPCETLVVALGGWSGAAVLQWLQLSLPIVPHSLQKLHVRPVGQPLGCAVRWGTINIVTRVDGMVHVGSKHDPMGFMARPTQAGKQWLLERLHTILPGVEVEVVEAAAGLAALTPDPERVPILGPLPGLDNVYVAVPSTNGFLHSALLAHVLTERFLHGTVHPFMPRMLPERVMHSPERNR